MEMGRKQGNKTGSKCPLLHDAVHSVAIPTTSMYDEKHSSFIHFKALSIKFMLFWDAEGLSTSLIGTSH